VSSWAFLGHWLLGPVTAYGAFGQTRPDGRPHRSINIKIKLNFMDPSKMDLACDHPIES
jgi:hypothetical protein